MTIWLDVSPEVAYERIIQRKFDSAGLNHLKKYRDALEKLLKDYPHIRVDGEGSIKAVHKKICRIVEDNLKL